MKKYYTLIMVSFISISVFSQTKKIKDLIGVWEITGTENRSASLQIVDSSTIVLTYMGEKKKMIDYKIDFTKSPAWFDFSTTDNSAIIKIKSLLQVFGDDIIKWQIFIDEDRPNNFSSSTGELFYLKKIRTSSVMAKN